MIAVEPHPIIHARLAFNLQCILGRSGDAGGGRHERSGRRQSVDRNRWRQSRRASHVVSVAPSANAIRVNSLRLARILGDAGVTSVAALKIDIEGYEDRALIPFFKEAPPSLWPRAVVIEHLSRDEWQQDCIADMVARGYTRGRANAQQHAASVRG